jgi:hypothetical protein
VEEATSNIIKETRPATRTLAPFYPPMSGSILLQQTQISHSQEFYGLTMPCPQNSCIQVSAASTNTQEKGHCHHHQSLKTKPSKKPFRIHEPPRQTKSTSSHLKIKNLIAIFQKKSTFLVSSPHKFLENYNISSSTALISTSTKRD